MSPRTVAWAVLSAVLLSAATAGVMALRGHWIGVGEARTQGQLDTCRAESARLRTLLQEQNAAVQQLQADGQRLVSERDAAAQAAVQRAVDAAAPLRERAAAVLREAVPTGADACAAASAAFDAELRAERGR